MTFKALTGLTSIKKIFLNVCAHLVIMVIVGQGSQERVCILWECSPCKTLVVDQYLSTIWNSSTKNNTFIQVNSKRKRACHPNDLHSSQPLSHHLSPSVKHGGRRARLTFQWMQCKEAFPSETYVPNLIL